MISIFMAVAAANLLAIDPRLSQSSKDLAQPYWDCVISNAVKLESSGGAGEEIAIASKQACREQGTDLQASIDVDRAMSTRPLEGSNSESIVANFEEELRREVILNVLAARAQRNDRVAVKP